jgi:hypothetical protein
MYSAGSDDSSVQTELYYDAKGILRFAFIKAGANNGTELEDRIYFSEYGKRIWEIQKLLKGPGYSFPNKWPDSDLFRDPKKAFKDKNPCPEL